MSGTPVCILIQLFKSARMPLQNDAIRFYSKKYFTNPEALLYVKISQPPSPSTIPRRHPRHHRQKVVEQQLAARQSSPRHHSRRQQHDVPIRHETKPPIVARPSRQPTRERKPVEAAKPDSHRDVVSDRVELIPESRRDDRNLVDNLLHELLDTEIKYVIDLKSLSSFYTERMVEQAEDASTAIISMEQTRTCFLDPLPIADVHTRLREKLSEAISKQHTTAKQVSLFCGIILDMIEDLRAPYTAYLAMFATSAHLLNRLRATIPKFAATLEEVRSQTGMDIGSMLILPVQRLPRYELFLDRLEKHTPGSRRVRRAREEFSRLIHEINQSASSTAQLEHLQWNEFDGRVNLVTPNRSLIRIDDVRTTVDGSAFWIRNSRSIVNIVIILCNDVIVVANRISGGGMRLRTVVALSGVRITDLEDNGDIVSAFTIAGKSTSLTIMCDGADKKQSYMEELRMALGRVNMNGNALDLDLLEMTVAIDLTES